MLSMTKLTYFSYNGCWVWQNLPISAITDVEYDKTYLLNDDSTPK